MNAPIREVSFSDDSPTRLEQLVSREWLVTAGNGSYACGSLGFVPTRRHHGLLIANQPAPQGRTISLVQLREELVPQDGSKPARLWGLETTQEGLQIHGSDLLKRFHLDCGFPIWSYEVQGVRVQKSIVMPHQTKSVCVRYSFAGDTTDWRLTLRPVIQFRGHNDSVATPCVTTCERLDDNQYEFTDAGFPYLLQVSIHGGHAQFVADPRTDHECLFRIEHARGYDHIGDLHSPGFFEVTLADEGHLTLTAAMDSSELIENIDVAAAFDKERARRERLIQSVEGIDPHSTRAELVLAADQFLMTPAKRAVDQEDVDPITPEPERRSIIAGYPWFTDWGRDTMISLTGLTLATHRPSEARQILLTFADYVRHGLIPNLFPEGGQQGMYHTADATLWYFQAFAEYELATGDMDLLPRLFPKLAEIIESHVEGTLFGIHVDSSDGLLVQGQQDVQLTWMDAKAGDWVVTPRRGKAVEINALWYNALRLFGDWCQRLGNRFDEGMIVRARESFNDRFWFEGGGYLYDVVDGEAGNDDSLRPNQLFAISLSHPVLDKSRWPAVLQACRDHLLTPVGLRSLAKTSKDYLGQYRGDVFQRDAAYHQGTVWSWLIGPLVKAWCRAYPDETHRARTWLSGLEAHLGEGCIGQISEIFSGDDPHEPKGCFAQAWGVAELLEALGAFERGGRR